MDYSLLVGIYDCTAAPLSEEESMENWYDEDGNDYLSSDELVEPVSPPGTYNNPISLQNMCFAMSMHIHV